MTIAETLDIDDEYQVEIHYDDDGRDNPLKEFDGQPTLVLHDKAENHFGWTTSTEWHTRLNCALEDILRHGHTRTLYGERGALAVLKRWMRAYWGIRVVLPVGAGEHSGTWTYLGEGEHWCDPGGWDSGWVGWLFATKEQITEWGFDDRSDEELEESIKACYKEFEHWVAGEVYGYVVTRRDGAPVDDDSCWGFYGTESYDERVVTEFVLTQRPVVGWTVETHLAGGPVTLGAVEDTDDPDEWIVQGLDGAIGRWRRGMKLELIHPGHMREAFMDAIKADRARRSEDQTEIEEARLAEIGASV